MQIKQNLVLRIVLIEEGKQVRENQTIIRLPMPPFCEFGPRLTKTESSRSSGNEVRYSYRCHATLNWMAPLSQSVNILFLRQAVTLHISKNTLLKS